MRRIHASTVIALVLVIVGIALAGFGTFRSADGYEWADDTAVPADGQPHEVRTGNGSVWIWVFGGDSAAPTCTATDVNGEPLQMRDLSTKPRRNGKADDYVAVAQFNSYDDPAVVTCEPVEGNSQATVFAEPAPKIVALAGIDPWIVRGALASVLGVLVLAGSALVRRANRAAV